jgi:uroporphyrin-III C-methyltransferase/precorrin-2 dehydrogenase/sirohydrochlorin ferrochelatase
MALFPLFLDLRGRGVLVVGAGSVALRKLQPLLETGARVMVGATHVHEAIESLERAGQLSIRRGAFESQWLEHDVWLVIAATNDSHTNQLIRAACDAAKIFVNVVDDQSLASAQFPARVERGDLQIAISTAGASPTLATEIRAQLEEVIDPTYASLTALLKQLRESIKETFPANEARRSFYRDVLADSTLARLLRAGLIEEAERFLRKRLVRAKQPQTGFVSLVGAGPGDQELLTLKAKSLLKRADVILHDRLISKDVLAVARRDALLIEVGKEAGHHHVTQEQIHQLMREHAGAGKHVVRLKCGDSFIFGRGGEELEYLRVHDIDYEVVPGITAAIACAAYAGIPLTHREHAHSVRFITAHCQGSIDTLDWQALARERQTLAVYMGVAQLSLFRDRLLQHGRAPSTPIALIERGTQRNQRVISGVLRDLPELARSHQIEAPAMLIVGEVAALADQLRWFGEHPARHAASSSLAASA